MRLPSAEHIRRRTAMGRGILPWVTGPSMLGRVDDGSWLLLTGASSPDMNFAFLHREDPDGLTEALTEIEERRLSAMLMLAGEGRALAPLVPAAFERVGEMPVMSKRLEEPDVDDDRVRRATSADRAAVNEMLRAAYGLPQDAIELATAPLELPEGGPLSIWVLEQDAEIVSAVTTTRIEDTVGLWTMATPPVHQRKGFGRALLAAVLTEARRDGAVLGLLGATPAGLPLYESTGWEVDEVWDLYVNAPSEQFS
jgi:GNAT superfamily N-acetyltransferase